MDKRKIIYAVIYVGIAVAFPALPLRGLTFIGGILTGGLSGMGKTIKDEFWKEINPFD